MKKQFTWHSLLILLFAVLIIVAFTPQQPAKKDQKEQNQGKGNQKNKDNQGKNEVNNNKGGKNVNANENKGQNEGKGNKPDNDNRGNSGNNGNNANKDKDVKAERYDWDRETFKDRRKFKNKEKVVLCHKFNRGDEPAVSIRVSSQALKAHMDHGDVIGECPVVDRGRFSDMFLWRRADYYNSLQEGQDQVVYSRSILDYALARLADSRLQLATYRNNNMPPAEIQRKEATVVELEQNVSLLETVLGVAAGLLANKL